MAQPKLIESPGKFLAVLEKSGLLKSQHMEAVKSSELASSDPITIARALLKKQLLTRWQAQQLLSGFYNLAFGKYTLCDQLGKGELGNVYLAENPKLGRKVALKTLSKRYVNKPELVSRFMDKARAAAALDHPNIIHVHDVASEGERHFVVMEHVDGQDLQTRVDAEGVLDCTQAIDFIRQAAEAMQYAHGEGVKHLDLKPPNLMVDKQGVVKILDIGVGHLRQLAMLPDANTGELMVSAISYMAPEQAREEDVDERADVYSLGSTLYFLLTGRAPFAAESDEERAKLKETKQALPIQQLRADAPPALRAVCDKAMALKADDRYASMAELLEAIGTWQNDAIAEVEVEELETAEVEEAEAETAEVETATPEPEPETIEVTVKPKQAVGPLSIDTGDEAKPAPGAIGGISINTKRRKKRKPEKKTEAAPAAEPDESVTETQEPTSKPDKSEAKADPPATKPASAAEAEPLAMAELEKDDAVAAPVEVKKGLPKALIIGGACAAAVLLLIMGVVVGVLLFGDRGDGPAVAQAAASDSEAADGEARNDADATPNAESAGNAEEREATEGNEDTPEATTAGGESTTDNTNENATTPDAAGPADAATVEVADQAGAPSGESGDADVATPEPAPAASPTPTASSETKPAEPSETKKPAAEEPDEKKKTEEKPPKIFDFVNALDLPAAVADSPEMVLGKVNVGPDELVFISLSGGDTAFNSRTEFTVQNAQDGVAPRDWEFYVTEASGDPIVIATLALPEKELVFKWAEAAATNVAATNLRNCSLKVTAGQAEPAQLALRTPRKIAPVAIDLSKNSGSAKWPLEGAPDRSSLRMEVEVTVKGHKAMVEPAQFSLQKSDYAYVYFAENRDKAALLLKVTGSATSKHVQIKIEPQFFLPGQKPARLTKATLRQLPQLQQQQAQKQAWFLAFEKEANKPQNRVGMQNKLALARQELEAFNQNVARLQQLETQMAAVNGNGSLQFRVFAETFDRPIELLVTDSQAEVVAP
ncbi:MAG: hypothetical protein CMJ64_21385 [Planctomycetaceae bacterium]|nr:hypothetical protein [Planctomycetaceae bacterium]